MNLKKTIFYTLSFILFPGVSFANSELIQGSDLNYEPCQIQIIEVDKELQNATVEGYGRWRLSRYMRVSINYIEQEFWLGPAIRVNRGADINSYWTLDFNQLSGEQRKDRLTNGNLISGIVDFYKVNYFPSEKIVEFEHGEFDEESDKETIIEQHTCRFR